MQTFSASAASRSWWATAEKRWSLAEFISLRYMLLRAWTAGGGLLSGLVQTFVFARILEPKLFSMFILVGVLGTTTWLFDLGFSRILFVNLRSRFLAGEDTLPIGTQVNVLASFYAGAIAVIAIVCFAVMALQPEVSVSRAAELGSFFFFSAFGLTWFVFRNACIAVNEYIYFETLESCRRLGYIAMLLLLLVGLPLPQFLVLINLSWAILIVFAGRKLIKRRAFTPELTGHWRRLCDFFRENRAAAVRTGTHSAGEAYLHAVLYLAVPLIFGLGSPTIVLDTTLKIFFGALTLCTAACDLLVPRQTAAYAARDRRALVRATVMAIELSALPTLAITALLLLDAKRLFALLLGHAAVMPASVTPLLFVFMTAGVMKTAPNFLLQYTGYFKAIARLSIVNAIVVTTAMLAGLLSHVDMVGLLRLYAGAFIIIALLYLGVAVRGPIRDAYKTASQS